MFCLGNNAFCSFIIWNQSVKVSNYPLSAIAVVEHNNAVNKEKFQINKIFIVKRQCIIILKLKKDN